MTWTAGTDVATGDVLSTTMWNNYMGASGSIMETGVAKVTTAGDLIYATGANAVARLAKGTARQVLAMNSGATAPEWQNSPQSLLDAKGEILGVSAANTLGALSAGTNDYILTADSTETLGFKWAAGGGTGPVNPELSGPMFSGSTNMQFQTSLSLTQEANKIQMFPIEPFWEDCTVTGFTQRVTSVTGTPNYRAGIYSFDGTTFTLVAQGSSTTLSTGTPVIFSGSLSASCSAGTRYFAAVLADADYVVLKLGTLSGGVYPFKALGMSLESSSTVGGSPTLPSSVLLSAMDKLQYSPLSAILNGYWPSGDI